MIVILGEFDAPKKLCTLPWMTYRLSFEAISNTSYTNDVGWGCMHRTGQMMLCQSLIYIFSSHPPSAQQASSNKSDIIGWFNDDPQLPFSIHKLALQGAKMGKSVGEWFSPTILCQVLRELVLESRLPVQVCIAKDGVIYKNKLKDSFPLLLLIPLRLGIEGVNPIYFDFIKDCLKLPFCMGIVGGKPASSLYFVGFTEEDGENCRLIYLDPHYPQLHASPPDLETYQCDELNLMEICMLDPSLLLSFAIKSQDELDLLCTLCGSKKWPFSFAATEPNYDELDALIEME